MVAALNRFLSSGDGLAPALNRSVANCRTSLGTSGPITGIPLFGGSAAYLGGGGRGGSENGGGDGRG